VAIARAAKNRGIAMGLSSFASRSVEDVAAANDKTFFQIYWCGDRDTLLQRMERAPIFLRGMVKRLAEKKARELGYVEIDEIKLDQFKGQMMGSMGGATGMASAAEAMEKGQLPWTAAAKAKFGRSLDCV